MNLKNPIVGSKGLWKLGSPYENYLPLNSILTCTAISNYGQLMVMGIDPYETYYRPYEINKDIYQKHFDGEGRIIFVKTDSGKRYSFPLHYLISYPIGDGVNYVSTGIGIRLGALPVNTNIELMIEQIKEICNLNVGVDIHVETMALSEVAVVSKEDHDRIEKSRKARRKAQTPALERIFDLNEKNKKLTTKLSLAEKKIIELSNKINGGAGDG